MQCRVLDTDHERANRIIAASCRYLEIDWDRIRGRRRDHDTAQARHLLCYVLARAGYTMAHISRLLNRNHSTVGHALQHVEQNAGLAAEGQRLAEAVLPCVGEADDNPRGLLRAVSRGLVQTLLGAVALREVRAIRAYVCGTLLCWERVPAPQAAWGLYVIAARPGVRTAVEDVLQTCGLSAYSGLIDLQLQRAGLR